MSEEDVRHRKLETVADIYRRDTTTPQEKDAARHAMKRLGMAVPDTLPGMVKEDLGSGGGMATPEEPKTIPEQSNTQDLRSLANLFRKKPFSG